MKKQFTIYLGQSEKITKTKEVIENIKTILFYNCIDNFTINYSTGFYKGGQEKTYQIIVIEHELNQDIILNVCKNLKITFEQECVLLTITDCDAILVD